ncbi:hypothetical protein [Ohtaekwangia koreensis]|uniref:Uncharacterized protein n=1 Tax=Ohtaekwangia koreensis TaxID=688867 RepID=A0A1T5JQ77_9BACT|nr:hypothetical protein [Ohtaekwangia koreensis]SKC53597.1 hypothetical protein SAMN05660236_1363 [Ohtaekwangia koreensis]
MTRENIMATRIRKQAITDDLITFECTIEDYTHFTLYVSQDLQNIFGKIDKTQHTPDIYFSVSIAQLTRLSRKNFSKEDKERYNILHKEYVRNQRNTYYREYYKINSEKRTEYNRKWYQENIERMRDYNRQYQNNYYHSTTKNK